MADIQVILTELEKLEPSGLAALTPHFRVFFPVIQQKLAGGVKQKEIIKLLSTHGVQVHHTQFNSLMKSLEAEHCGDTETKEVPR